jgi:hypothetical protein
MEMWKRKTVFFKGRLDSTHVNSGPRLFQNMRDLSTDIS